jgi:hypothetical protein
LSEINPQDFFRTREDTAGTMAVTQADLDLWTARVASLNQAIADGVRQVTLGDQTITYNTTDSLIRARDDARRELAKATAEFSTGTVAYPRQTRLFQSGRGFW